jgi:hypothetical protein
VGVEAELNEASTMTLKALGVAIAVAQATLKA